jgi:hypothetical protein
MILYETNTALCTDGPSKPVSIFSDQLEDQRPAEKLLVNDRRAVGKISKEHPFRTSSGTVPMASDNYLVNDPNILLLKENRRKNISNIYHYTSIDGLEGIISEKKIRATHISYLNDAREYVEIFLKSAHTFYNRQDRVEKEYKDIFSPLFDLTKNWIDNDPLTTQHNDVYVCSLSEKKDDLNQWRGYAITGGYQIGFCFNYLQEAAKKSDNYFWLFPCIYEDSDKTQIIERLFKEAVTKFDEKGSDAKKIQSWFISTLRYIAPIFKDANFKDEKEWRLFAEKSWNDPNRRFRKRNGIFVPYIDIDLSLDGKISLSEIVIGPGINNHHAMYSLSSFIRKKKEEGILEIEDDRIELSNVPYRPML